MRHVFYRIFTIGSYEKEEKWLNEMSSKGLQLVDACLLRYVFEDGKAGEYQYRLQMLDHYPGHPESLDYFRFLEETGIEKVATYSYWAYFRRKTSDEPFSLFSDIDSKARHYRRIINFTIPFSLIFLVEAILHLWHKDNLLTGLTYLTTVIIMQLAVLPVRILLHSLKEEQKVAE